MNLPPPANEVTTLRPKSVSRRKLPLNLKPNDLPLFNHELEREIPSTRLLKLRNVSVSAEGILFRGGEMLPESFAFPHTRASWKRRSVVKFFVNNYLRRRRRRFVLPAILVTDDWSGGYFHWLADVLPRLYTVKDELKQLTLLLPASYHGLDYVSASLAPFNIGAVEFIEPDEVLVVENLQVPTHTAPSGHYNDELIREVGNLLADFYAGPERAAPWGRIYISRRDAPKRKVVNEEEVMQLLQSFDFQEVRTEAHSFAEQVRIAAQARYLVSNHGAGLTNMLFMDSGAGILELRHATDAINNCYFTLASALNLNYFYQSCQPENAADPHTANLLVDTETLKKNIELMLQPGQ